MRGDQNLCAHREICAALPGQGEPACKRQRDASGRWNYPVPWCLKVVGWLALRGLQRASCCFSGRVCGLVNKNSRIGKELGCNRSNNWVNFWINLLVWEAGRSMCCEAVWAERCTGSPLQLPVESSLTCTPRNNVIMSDLFFFPRKHPSWIPRGSLESWFALTVNCKIIDGGNKPSINNQVS